jgi:hypothetical protein
MALRRDQSEAVERLGSFVPEESRVWQLLQARFGSKLTMPMLEAITTMVSKRSGATPDRQARRRKGIMVKWLQEQIQCLESLLPRMILVENVRDGSVRALKREGTAGDGTGLFHICPPE